MAAAPVPAPIICTVAVVYPVPGLVISISVTVPAVTVTVAVAPVPSPVIVAVVDPDTYPEPSESTRIWAIGVPRFNVWLIAPPVPVVSPAPLTTVIKGFVYPLPAFVSVNPPLACFAMFFPAGMSTSTMAPVPSPTTVMVVLAS